MLADVLKDYMPIGLFLLVATFVSVAAAGLSFLLARHRPYKEKNEPYECGFPPFGEVQPRFNIRFYLVAILFIVFDLEVAFLFPWAVALHDIGWAGFASMMVFLGVLTVGFIYEWKKGALEWD
jgi:NADH-quinone oxidoreductase subunit A